jgi:hypothetical protein
MVVIPAPVWGPMDETKSKLKEVPRQNSKSWIPGLARTDRGKHR